MKIGSKCPYCDDIMSNEYVGSFILIKKCTARTNHQIVLMTQRSDDEVLSIQIFVNNFSKWAHWELGEKILWISERSTLTSKPPRTAMLLPYFDPDLTNYHKMVRKIKTYILFS